MGLKQCDKCSEMADEAKAYCPGCGHAFVEEEKRQKASEYESLDSTVQFGQTMYNEMLSDMGLNIAKPPAPAEKRIEVLAPAAPQVVQPQVVPPPKPPSKPTPASNAKWFILGGVVLIIGFLIVLAAAAGVFIWWTRFR